MTQNIVQLTTENFRPIMLEQSAQKLVVVYFYAAWDEGSIAQLDVMQSFAAQYPDALILATVNSDEQAEIVQQFGVKGLPTTILVKDGQPIDGFTGPQDQTQLQATFANYLPKPEDELLLKAKGLIEQADYLQAFGVLKQANELAPERMDIVLAFADASIEISNLELSKSLIAKVMLADQDAYYHAIVGKIELAEKASESPELLELQEKHETNPDDFTIRVELAVQLHQAHKSEEALELLFSVVKKDLNFGDAKKVMLDMINALADGDPLKSAYRRKIYSLLY
jgi:putative thioredoxin